MRTYTSRAELDERYDQTVRQMMESQAYRELAAAQMFGHGLQYVPELRWLKFMGWHIREELEHYEAVVKMYRKFTGEEVEPKVNVRLTQRPIEMAHSWFELAMAQFLFDQAALHPDLMEVMPLTVVDGRPLGSGRPGPVTQRLSRLYREMAEARS